MSIRFTRPTLGHLSARQIRVEIYEAMQPSNPPHTPPFVFRHETTYVRKDGKREEKKNTHGEGKTNKEGTELVT